MRFLIFLNLVILSVSFSVHATSGGSRLEGIIVSVSGEPAICLPVNRRNPFPLGWFSIVGRDAAIWAFELKSGASPLLMEGGDCIVLGLIPIGYQVTNYGHKPMFGRVEEGKTYSVSLSDAWRPTDSYSAVFCVEDTGGGSFHYRQYARLTGGLKLAPPCGDSTAGR